MSQQFRDCGGKSIYRSSGENCNIPSNLYDQKKQVDSILEYMSQGLDRMSGGPQGVQGPSGFGLQGAQGIQGASNGPPGIQGTQGIQGLGIQGVQGTRGLQGVQGPGIQGPQGSQGTTGIQGVSGALSSQGAQGIQGFQGAQGLLGAQGVSGTLGSQGIQGIQGGSNISSRTDTSYTTVSLAQNEVADFTMGLGRMSDLIAIQVSEPSWVRIYRSSSQRSEDTRSSPGGALQTVINLGDSKPYSENVTTSAPQTIIQNPVPLLQGDANGLVYVRLVKLSTGSGVITLTTTTNPQEN